VIIGRAFIDQKGDLVPMRSPAREVAEETVIETAVREVASAPAERRTVPDKKAITGEGAETGAVVEISATGAGKSRPADAPTAMVDEATPGKAADDAAPQTGETARFMTDASTDAAITEETARQEKGPAITTMARSTADRDRRGQILHWQAVIDSSSARDVQAAAHLSLAGIWYDLAMAGPDPEDLSAALRAHRDALEFAAGDSVRQLLLERISRLEDRQQKK